MLAFAPRAGRPVLTALGFSAALLVADATGAHPIGAARAAEPLAAATALVAPPSPPGFFSFSDTIVSYRFQGPSAEPGIGVQRPDGTPTGRREPREIPKNVVNLFHTNAWTYGTNLVSLDLLRSGSQDPAGNAFGSFPDIGATELYLIYRGTLSPNRIFDTDVFAIPGLVKDIGLAFGVDANAKNTTFNSQKRAGTFGLNFAFDVPAGFLNLKVQGYKEFAHNGFAAGRFRSVEFQMTPEFELTYAIPLPFTGLPLSLSGFNTIILPKGRYGRTNEYETQLEFVSQTNLVLDVGQLAGGPAHRLEVFAGFQYWHNKFGADPRRTINTEEKALIAGVSYHLP
ncbi:MULTISPECIES: hypothetical protein [unclassified Methylobacterium]|jgi:hypothetical protein|uniref:hypothetical protein n=1 Tax=unclassified Methylobacterium TaxID=2615210 RepID=UPI000A759F62|nr:MULTISPECIES: hypothetical protein [unclassified Methylobacterium]